MSIEFVIVLLIVGSAAVYFGVTLLRKIRSFSPAAECADDCGCGRKSKN